MHHETILAQLREAYNEVRRTQAATVVYNGTHGFDLWDDVFALADDELFALADDEAVQDNAFAVFGWEDHEAYDFDGGRMRGLLDAIAIIEAGIAD